MYSFTRFIFRQIPGSQEFKDQMQHLPLYHARGEGERVLALKSREGTRVREFRGRGRQGGMSGWNRGNV